MGKDITICFRTNEGLRESLDKVAGEERRSISAMIENILLEYLKENKLARVNPRENRRFPRKEVSLPALVSAGATEDLHSGTVLDLSLTGLRIAVPKDSTIEIVERDPNVELHIRFALPNEKTPVMIKAKPERVRDINGKIEVGASFSDCDFIDYQRLQNYLIQ